MIKTILMVILSITIFTYTTTVYAQGSNLTDTSGIVSIPDTTTKVDPFGNSTSSSSNKTDVLIQDIASLIIKEIESKINNSTSVKTIAKTNNQTKPVPILLGCKDGIVIFKSANLSMGCISNPFKYTAFNSTSVITHNDTVTKFNGGTSKGDVSKPSSNVGKCKSDKRGKFHLPCISGGKVLR